MALNEENVLVAQTGVVYVAPVDTTGPTSVDGELDAAFDDCGYLSEQSISLQPNVDVTKLRAWQNSVTVRVIRRGQDISVTFEMIESRSAVAQQTYWGDGATVEPDGSHVVVGDLSTPTDRAIVIDLDDGDLGTRIYLPKATRSNQGAIAFLNNDYQKMPVTFEGTQYDGKFCEIWNEVDGS